MSIDSKKIYSKFIAIDEITDSEKVQMLNLMKEFYDDVLDRAFNDDLKEKDYCIILYNENGSVKGFSTQKEMSIETSKKTINGIFSGDTIIHKDYWGSLELYKEFARAFIKDGDEDFYWFLISKGYKTYKMLPLFFKDFYPNYKKRTPSFEQEIMDEFGKKNFPLDYDKNSGVIKYKGIKDKLKDGVADITERQRRDKDIKYFTQINPEHIGGDDLVCLAKLNQDNLRNTAKRLFRDV